MAAGLWEMFIVDVENRTVPNCDIELERMRTLGCTFSFVCVQSIEKIGFDFNLPKHKITENSLMRQFQH